MIKRFSQLDVSKYALVAYFLLQFVVAGAQTNQARNPVIFADVPDISVIRVGENYYMSSTTMHMSPGVPVMKSTDLINWEIVSYASKSLGDIDELNLKNGKSTYGRGSWASSLRYHKGRYYVSTFAQTTNKTYIYSTVILKKTNGTKFPSAHRIMIIRSFSTTMVVLILFTVLVN